MRIYQDGTCRYNGQAYATLHEALAALWQQNSGGRRGYTIELNSDYFRDAVGYLKEIDEKEETISLFDMIG